jgi:TetR/AcrR family transcriptional repressor of nem operon
VAKPKLDRKTILRNSLSVFKEKGYNATTMNDLATANGILKGSIYHYISSKEELMIEVLQALNDHYTNKVFSKVYENELSIEDRLDELVSRAEQIYTFEEGGDFFVNIGLETLNTNPRFTEIIRSFFKEWFKALIYLYMEKGFDKEIAEIKAETTVAEIEGAVMLMRLLKDPNYLHRTLQNLKHTFRQTEHEY